MSTWLMPQQDLSPEQVLVVEAPMDRHLLVLGHPGSGKTLTLVHRAARLRNHFGSGVSRFRIILYTNVLRDYIRSGLEFMGLPVECACTFDAWCMEMCRRWGLPRMASGEGGLLRRRLMVLDAFRERTHRRRELDFALVDEGQDLGPEAVETLVLASSHVTLYADHLQRIYEGGAHAGRIREILGVGRSDVSLLAGYRNSPDVAVLAAHFIDDPKRRERYLRGVPQGTVERERPLFFSAVDREGEMDRLAETVHRRRLLNQRTAILLPQNDLVEEVAAALADRDIEVETAVSRSRQKLTGPSDSPRFDDLVPKVATYHSAKGITFDAVLLPWLDDEAFYRFHGEIRRRILFVGMARAIRWVYLSGVEGEPFEELGLLARAADAGHLVFQRGADARTPDGEPDGEELPIL